MSKSEPLQGHARYKKIRDVNRGAFGFVQLAHDDRQNKLVAIKFIERGDKVSTYVQRELINHRLLWHPHIIKFKEAFLTRYHLCIVMEYADGGDLYDYVVKHRQLKEQQARWVFQQLIIAIDYLHKAGVASRDIKLENTLLVGNPDRPLVKLCDFGYAKHEELQSAPDSKVGTPAYLAPEVICASKGQTYDAKAADIWSCGVLLYVMLVGHYPFERLEDKEQPPNKRLQRMIQRIVRVQYTCPDTMTPECQSMLGGMLVAEPARRATIAEIQAHPWYQKNLPPGVAEMNKKMRKNLCPQSEAEVYRVVQLAQHPYDPAVEGSYGDFAEDMSM